MSFFEPAPGWAFSWCWYFMFLGVLGALTAIATLIILITTYKGLKEKGHHLLLSLYFCLLVFQSITSMVTFWMCRSSLKPNAK